jgi:hypothetical protein
MRDGLMQKQPFPRGLNGLPLRWFASKCVRKKRVSGQAVAEIGAEGIMVDVWWGLCEKAPGTYDFSPYTQLFQR